MKKNDETLVEDKTEKDDIETDNSRLLSALGYIPVVGWIIPLFLKKEDQFCQFHGKQGFIISLCAVILGVLVAFLRTEIFQMLMILSYFCIFAFLFIYGFVTAYNEKKVEIPVIKDIANKLYKKFKI